MRHKILVSIVIIILLVGTCVGFLLYSQWQRRSKWWEIEIFHYEVEITPIKTTNYTIYLPVPLISRHDNPNNGKPIALMNELQLVDGNATFEIITTAYGYSLKITSSEYCVIKAHKEFENETTEYDDDYAFGELSMSIGDKYNSPKRIYYNSATLESVKLYMNTYNRRFHSEGGHNYEWGIANYYLSIGWQEVDLYIDSTVTS